MGAGTVIADSPSLNVRDCNLNINRHPVKAIFDPSSRLTNISKTEEESLGTTTFNENSSLIYIGSKNTFDSLIKRYSKVKIELIEWEKEFSIVDLPKELNIAYKRLLSKELQSIFVEGGPMMHRVLWKRICTIFYIRLLILRSSVLNPIKLAKPHRKRKIVCQIRRNLLFSVPTNLVMMFLLTQLKKVKFSHFLGGFSRLPGVIFDQ